MRRTPPPSPFTVTEVTSSQLIWRWGPRFVIGIVLLTVGSLWSTNTNAFGQVRVNDDHALRTLSQSYGDEISLLTRLDAMEAKLKAHEKRFWLESLEPIWHFRAKYFLGKTEDAEDKDQVVPFFLANFIDAADKNLYPRRIYIDLGINTFKSSICFIMQDYPVHFDQFYGFECATDMRDLQALRPEIEKCIKATPTKPRKAAYKAEEVIRNSTFFYNYIGAEDSTSTKPPTIALNRFLREIVKEEDFVVLKMDVEGMEYDLIQAILDEKVDHLIDEMFVEVHYHHREMEIHDWQKFPRTRAEATALFQKARDAGLFIHPWP